MTKIEQQVMAGVALIYTARALVSATALKLYALVASFGALVFFASVPNVLHNVQVVATNGGLPNVVLFIVYAILGTTIIVQFALAIGAVAFVSLLISGVRSFFVGKVATA